MRFFLLLVVVSTTACDLNSPAPLQYKSVIYRDQQVRSLVEVIVLENLPELAFRQAFSYFDLHQTEIENKNWLSVIDFTLPSNTPRLFILNLNDGVTERFLVAHGEGSDPENTGLARRFSNIEGSLMSSLGFYLVSEAYFGSFGISARLDGLSPSNSRARDRNIVLHGFEGVDPEKEKQQMTQGCPAVEIKFAGELVQKLHGKSLLYSYIDGL